MTYRRTKKHILGYSKNIYKWQRSVLNYVLDHGAEHMELSSDFTERQKVYYYPHNKPSFFLHLEKIERFLNQNPDFRAGFIVYPRSVRLCLGFEMTKPKIVPPWGSFAPESFFKKPYMELISAFYDRLSMFRLEEDVSFEARVSLLRDSPFFEELVEASQILTVSLDKLMESSE
jgi:hypothetical protein